MALSGYGGRNSTCDFAVRVTGDFTMEADSVGKLVGMTGEVTMVIDYVVKGAGLVGELMVPFVSEKTDSNRITGEDTIVDGGVRELGTVLVCKLTVPFDDKIFGAVGIISECTIVADGIGESSRLLSTVGTSSEGRVTHGAVNEGGVGNGKFSAKVAVGLISKGDESLVAAVCEV